MTKGVQNTITKHENYTKGAYCMQNITLSTKFCAI